MNKLREKIRQATDMRPAALGFAASGRKKSASLLVLVTGAKNSVGQVASHVDGYVVASPGDRPADSFDSARGLVVRDGKLPSSQEFDFVLVDEQTPASALLSEDLAYVMRADVSMTDSLLRALHTMPLDGLLIRSDGPVTVGVHVALLRLSAFAGKPLFVEVAEPPSPSDLEVYREAGAVAIVVNADVGAARISDLRKAIDGMPPRRKPRRDDRETVAVVGQVAPSAGELEELDEE